MTVALESLTYYYGQGPARDEITVAGPEFYSNKGDLFLLNVS